ncbi:unnamed protein product [Schistosoma mattheei]|uniref:Uncharacterized protein n=1 Tax=Schistosoma mattheei TaxID=31246 RepID=A0A183P367_9TREM|nr:unnamed protein product [Schistosoma mattheei]
MQFDNLRNVDARLRSNGVIVFKIQLDDCVAVRCYSVSHSKNYLNSEPSEDTLRHLITKRQNLLLEIQSIDQNSNLSQWSKTEIRQGNLNIIKANTELQTKLEVSPDKPCVNLTIQTNDGFHVKACLMIQFDDFCNLAIWLNQNFILGSEIIVNEQSSLFVLFEELRSANRWISTINKNLNEILNNFIVQQQNSKRLLYINMTKKGEITIKTENLELAANLVQSISRHFNITELSSTCDFPELFNTLEELIEMSNAYSLTQQQILMDMTIKSDDIKRLVVKSEDYRLAGNCCEMTLQMEGIRWLLLLGHGPLGNSAGKFEDH